MTLAAYYTTGTANPIMLALFGGLLAMAVLCARKDWTRSQRRGSISGMGTSEHPEMWQILLTNNGEPATLEQAENVMTSVLGRPAQVEEVDEGLFNSELRPDMAENLQEQGWIDFLVVPDDLETTWRIRAEMP